MGKMKKKNSTCTWISVQYSLQFVGHEIQAIIGYQQEKGHILCVLQSILFKITVPPERGGVCVAQKPIYSVLIILTAPSVSLGL